MGLPFYAAPCSCNLPLCCVQVTDETCIEDDATESDTCSSDMNRKRPLDSSEDLPVDVPSLKMPHVDADNVTSD